eukprot:2180905-Pleurochrysis_carterae.AAC.1
MSTAPGMLTATVSHPPTVFRASPRRWHGSRLDPRRVPRLRWAYPVLGPALGRAHQPHVYDHQHTEPE